MKRFAAFLMLAACSSPTELPQPEPTPDMAGPSCDDGQTNGLETDEDCGGPDCDPCGVTRLCDTASDCETASCDGKCLAATCSDEILNGSETDTDCGGPACPACETASGDVGISECGDGEVAGEEECDDANDDDTDACIACREARCGDAFVQSGVEECDDANEDDTDSCVACRTAICGDGAVQQGVEACDDANSIDSDACVDCQLAACGDGAVQVGTEDCDDQNDDDTDACIDCTAASCGDGFVRDGVEACDDQNNLDTDACVACQAARCGDGFVRAGTEMCDTAGQSATCDADCTAVVCGDGVINAAAGEQCEGGTGCNASCRWEPVVYTLTNLSDLVGLTSDCSTTSTFPHTCQPAQSYGFFWMDTAPFTPGAVKVEFSTGNYCSTSRTKNSQLNSSASGQFVLNASQCDCQPANPPLNSWDLFNVQSYNSGGLNTFTVPVLDGCEGIALTNGQFYARVTVSP